MKIARIFFSHRTEEDRREDRRRSMIIINRTKSYQLKWEIKYSSQNRY